MFSQTGMLNAYAAEQDAISVAIRYDAEMREHLRPATIDENYEDDKVIVILNYQHSRINGEVSLNDFCSVSNCIEFASVNDEFRVSNVRNRINDQKNFRQILSLELKEKGKENVLEAIKELVKLDNVLIAQPSYIYDTVNDWAPNDTFYAQQWGLTGAHGIKAENAWNLTKGDVNPRLRVGIFEGAVQANHPDLRVIAGNFTPAAGTAADHGTHVAGIIGTIANNNNNNNQGIAGIAQVEIALLNRNTFLQSLVWAENNDIRVVNASFYYTAKSGVLRFLP